MGAMERDEDEEDEQEAQLQVHSWFDARHTTRICSHICFVLELRSLMNALCFIQGREGANAAPG